MRDLAALAAPLARPALQLVPGEGPSYYGGMPLVPAGFEWPSNRQGRPLSFLASLDLEDLAQPWLPQEGQLLFFYDLDEYPWGFADDRGGWRVFHVTGTALQPQKKPLTQELPRVAVRAQPLSSVPSVERPEVRALLLTDEEARAWTDMRHDAHTGETQHQVGGFPTHVQNDDMEQACHNDSSADGPVDWRLLLQVDSDDALGVSFGDCGLIYFWIRECDVREARFDRVWLQLQCF